MNQMLQLTLLGNPRVEIEGQAITGFLTRKAEALFYYLAVTRQSHERPMLAALFWPECSEHNARHNLRDVVSNLRRLVGSHLIISRRSLAFNTAAPYQLDVTEIERLEKLHQQQPPDFASLSNLTRLYKGDFLDGFELPHAPDFELWAVNIREYLREQVILTLDHLTAHYIQNQEVYAGLESVGRLLSLESWRESAHCQRMTLLALNRQRQAALLQYEACRNILAAEFGVEPELETTQLYTMIRDGQFTPASAVTTQNAVNGYPSLPPSNFPRLLTSFLGRDQELYQLVGCLRDPANPLITITGEGGVGKTRLALAAAWQVAADFHDGIWFVPLSELSTPASSPATQVAQAISNVFDLPPQSCQSPLDQVIEFLRRKHLLLILDNFEPFIEATSCLLNQLRTTPGLKLLITSRQRLHVQAEKVIVITGLPVPPDAQSPTRTYISRLIQQYSSLQLFEDRAGRAVCGFRIDEANLPAIIRICQLVEGLPLGIELAAAQLETMAAEEILAALQNSYDVLTTDMDDVAPRHRSIPAVLESSWQQLTPDEALILAKCSVFHGGVTAKAGSVVAGATPQQYTALLRKSMLRLTEDGRYRMHELLRQLAAAKLATMNGQQAETEQKHCIYFMDHLAQREIGLNQDVFIQKEIHAEIDNIRTAWNWAIETNNLTHLAGAIRTLAQYYQLAGLFAEGATMFAKAANQAHVLATTQDNSINSSTLAMLLLEQSFFCERLADLQSAAALAEEALAIGRSLNNPYLIANAYNRLSAIHWLNGDVTAGLHTTKLAHQAGQCTGDNRTLAITLTTTAMFHQAQSNYELALSCYEAARIHAHQAANLRLQNSIVVNLVALYSAIGRPYHAYQLTQELLQKRRHLGDRAGEANTLFILGVTEFNLGKIDDSFQHLRSARLIFQEMGERGQESFVLASLGELMSYTGRTAAAIAYCRKAITTLSHASGRLLEAHVKALIHLGHAHTQTGKLAAAHNYLQKAQQLLTETDGYQDEKAMTGACLAQLFVSLGDYRQAIQQIDNIWPTLSAIATRWDCHLMFILLTTHRVLSAHNDQRAAETVSLAAAALTRLHQQIPDAETWYAFVHNLPANQEMVILSGLD